MNNSWWRTALVTVLVVLTGIVAPLSVVTSWADTQVSDTEAFVASYAPLADDPAVQQAVAAKVSEAIQSRLDLPGLTQELLNGISNPIASRLLPSLTGPINSMISEFIDKQVAAFVASDTFRQVWNVALRATHTQFVNLISGNDAGALALDEGKLQLQLAPFVEAVKQRLVANGFPLAERIPAVTTSIDLVQLDPVAVARAQAGYRLLGGLSQWMPWLLLLLPALALALARDKRRTLIASGLAVAAGIAVVWLSLRAVVARATSVAAANGIPEAATAAITDGSFGPMRGPALAIAVVGLVVAVLAWLTARQPVES